MQTDTDGGDTMKKLFAILLVLCMLPLHALAAPYFEYIEAVAKGFFGVEKVECFTAEGLDIWGADVGAIMEEAKRKIE